MTHRWITVTETEYPQEWAALHHVHERLPSQGRIPEVWLANAHRGQAEVVSMDESTGLVKLSTSAMVHGRLIFHKRNAD